MKTLNKTKIALAGSVALASTIFLTTPAVAAPGGTDITHFTVITGMTNNLTGTTNNGVDTNADGAVMATQNEQGHVNNQKLTIMVTGLSSNTTYELVAAFDSDTNMVDVGPFTTDGKGKAAFNYTSLGNGHGGGDHTTPLPDSLNPVSLIRELDVVNSNLQAVLTADLSTPEHLQYLIKRNLSTNNIRASLMIEANATHTHFRLLSTGLMPNTDYVLAFNGEGVQTNSSDHKGRLDIHTLVETPPFILDVRSVELWDTSSNVVLQTELP